MPAAAKETATHLKTITQGYVQSNETLRNAYVNLKDMVVQVQESAVGLQADAIQAKQK